jgi:hypothetical protein
VGPILETVRWEVPADSYPNGSVKVMVSGFARGIHSGNCPLGGSSGQLSKWPCESHGVRYMDMCMCMCMYMYMDMCMYVYVHVYVYVYVYVYICM